MPRMINNNHPSLVGGATIFIKQVKSPDSVKQILQPASRNKKLGGVITKGRWKGLPMFALSLEERKTCPRTCQQWRVCYGNNMPFANRIDHTAHNFYDKILDEIRVLLLKNRDGIVIRLHVLGDFFSKDYVNFWINVVRKYDKVKCFGYTHQPRDSEIGRALEVFNSCGAWIRWSDAGGAMSANTDTLTTQGEGIHCPEQTGKTAGCSTCGLCWSITKPIRFSLH